MSELHEQPPVTRKSKPSTVAVVAGIDFDVEGERALDAALHLVAQRRDAQLHVVYVDPSLGAMAEGVRLDAGGLQARANEALARVRELCRKRMAGLAIADDAIVDGRVIAHYRTGAPADQIVQLAVEVDADLVVVGTHGRRGVKRLVMGSIAAGVLQRARCAVYVVRRKDHEGIGVVPEIEPPCPECVATRRQTGGGAWWCERHAGVHLRPHHYSYVSRAPSSSPAPWVAAFD